MKSLSRVGREISQGDLPIERRGKVLDKGLKTGWYTYPLKERLSARVIREALE